MDLFTDLTKDQGLWKRVIQEGNGSYPKSNSTVTIKYKGAHENETIFEENDDLSFKLDDGEVIKGFEIGIKTMQKGEASVFVIRHDYAYGKDEYALIPPFSTLIYFIELIDFTP